MWYSLYQNWERLQEQQKSSDCMKQENHDAVYKFVSKSLVVQQLVED